MNDLILGAYILIWPALTLWILVVICKAVLKDVREAKKENRELV
ncbi:putative transporter small subunit [Oceanisphaera psychrotolerans]|nr:putative transporter small subunit [Oceanisphaera psychrotolerans]